MKKRFIITVASAAFVALTGLKAEAQRTGTITVPAGRCAVQVASRQTMAEVTEFISTLHHSFRNIQVFSTTSGWYAITVGQFSNEFGPTRAALLVNQNLIPNDSFCSSGRTYLAEVDMSNGGAPREVEDVRRSVAEEAFNIPEIYRLDSLVLAANYSSNPFSFRNGALGSSIQTNLFIENFVDEGVSALLIGAESGIRCRIRASEFPSGLQRGAYVVEGVLAEESQRLLLSPCRIIGSAREIQWSTNVAFDVWLSGVDRPGEVVGKPLNANSDSVDANSVVPALNTELADASCRRRWSTRGVLDTQMFNYCMNRQREGHANAVYLYERFLRSEPIENLDEVVQHAVDRWLTRSEYSFNMVAFEIETQGEAYLDLQYEVEVGNVELSQLERCKTGRLPQWTRVRHCVQRLTSR
jgi:hypothetical protein